MRLSFLVSPLVLIIKVLFAPLLYLICQSGKNTWQKSWQAVKAKPLYWIVTILLIAAMQWIFLTAFESLRSADQADFWYLRFVLFFIYNLTFIPVSLFYIRRCNNYFHPQPRT